MWPLAASGGAQLLDAHKHTDPGVRCVCRAAPCCHLRSAVWSVATWHAGVSMRLHALSNAKNAPNRLITDQGHGPSGLNDGPQMARYQTPQRPCLPALTNRLTTVCNGPSESLCLLYQALYCSDCYTVARGVSSCLGSQLCGWQHCASQLAAAAEWWVFVFGQLCWNIPAWAAALGRVMVFGYGEWP